MLLAVFVLSSRVRLRDDDHHEDDKTKGKKRERKKLKKESAPCCILWGENAAISNVVFIKTTQDYVYILYTVMVSVL